MRRAAWVLACLGGVGGVAHAQGIPGEIVPAGETVAGATGADVARLNPGSTALVHTTSVRLTGVGEFQRGDTALNAVALTAVSPLWFDFAGSLGLTWQHPQAGGQTTDVVTAEAGLAYAFLRTLGVGVRFRLSGASAPPLDGALAMDLGATFRPTPWLSLAVTGRNLLGPRVPARGLDRAAVAGVAFRPTGTEAFTLGVDGSYTQAGDGWVRAGARVRVPSVGYLRAEGVLDLPTDTWRASVGAELVWGEYAAGGGVLFGGGLPNGATPPLGGYASVAWESARDHGLPEPGVVVSVVIDGDQGARTIGHLLLRLEQLRRDPRVRAVVFAPRGEVSGLANAEELREAFGRLRAAGIGVVCHLTEPNGSAYYACAAADRITMDAAGSLRAAGIRTSFYFLGDALHHLGVRTEFVRIGAWKSAAEQFTRRGSTPEARAQEEQLLDDFYQNFLEGIASARAHASHRTNLPGAEGPTTTEHARQLIEGGPYTAREAFRLGFVDAIEDREAAERHAQRTYGGESVVALDAYAGFRARGWAPAHRIAVVYIDGDMIDGESRDIPFIGMHFTGDRTIRETIDALASRDDVSAIVLRIDSGGGSATAGEMMWRSIARAARRKPLVVSMGRVAASAAYYVSAPAREIFADPSTITGSIGIFFGKADVATLLDRLDVGVETMRRGVRADMDSIFRPWTEDEHQVVSRLIGEFYNQFLERVATGRHLTTAQVNDVGEGRVFAASRARGLHLVDTIGGLDAALDRARALAGLDADADVIELPVRHEGLLSTLAGLVAANGTPEPLAQMFAQSELRLALGWLITVNQIGASHPLALTEWPILAP